jgi:ribosomal protein L19E
MHRLIMGVTDPKNIIDHKDCDGLNNQKSNLRRCTQGQNQANRPKRSYSIGKYKGIALAPTKRKVRWRAQIKNIGKVLGLGYFDTQEEAAMAYDKAALEIHGEFANLNFK